MNTDQFYQSQFVYYPIRQPETFLTARILCDNANRAISGPSWENFSRQVNDNSDGPIDYSIKKPSESASTFVSHQETSSTRRHIPDFTSEFKREPSEKTCHVCGDIASKHQAYGGKVCHSCRAFFRRSVQSSYYKIFACAAKEDCLIDVSTRKSCKHCRFKKCLGANMKISWVLPEQERERRFNKLKKVTLKPKPGEISIALATPIPRAPPILLTVEEQLRLENLRDYVNAMAVPRLEHFFNCEPECLQHLAHASFFGGPLDYGLWKRFTNACDLFHHEMFLNLDSMKELTLTDGLKLIRWNGLASFSFLEAVFVDEEDSVLSKNLKFATRSGNYPFLRNLLHSLKVQGKADNNPIIRYNQIYIPGWGATLRDEERHCNLLYKMKAFARPKGSHYGSSDPILIAIMRIIIAFYPEFLELQQREVCEKILYQHCMLLHRYIKKTYGDHANAKFAQAMATCVSAREAAEILRRQIR